MNPGSTAALLVGLAVAAASVKIASTVWLLRQRRVGRRAPADEALWYAGKLSALLLLAACIARTWLLGDRPTFWGLALLGLVATPVALGMMLRRRAQAPRARRDAFTAGAGT